jgi:hypothetical protein
MPPGPGSADQDEASDTLGSREQSLPGALPPPIWGDVDGVDLAGVGPRAADGVVRRVVPDRPGQHEPRHVVVQ